MSFLKASFKCFFGFGELTAAAINSLQLFRVPGLPDLIRGFYSYLP